MASDPHAAPPTAPSRSASPIENELPTYRAISGWAVASLLFGVVSSATFASIVFLIASVGAIACGVVALRMIRRYPDLLTGTGLANFGIALGLITGLAAPTITFTQRSIIGRQAASYAGQLVEALEQKGATEAFWLAQPATTRDRTTPRRLIEEMEADPQSEMMGGDERLNALRAMARRLESSDRQHIHVDGVEGRGFSGITPYAFIRLMLDGPETDEFPAEQFALLRVEAASSGGGRQWYLREVTFPYETGTRSNVVESAHGHDH